MRMVYFLLHFIATIFINRGLTTALKGEYAYIINIVSVLAIVGGMGLDLLYLEYIKKYGEKINGFFLGLTYIFSSLFLIIAFVILILNRQCSLFWVLLLTSAHILYTNVSMFACVKDISSRNLILLIIQFLYVSVLFGLYEFKVSNVETLLLLYFFNDLIVSFILIIKNKFKLNMKFISCQKNKSEFIIKVFILGIKAMLISLLIAFNYNLDIIMLKKLGVELDLIGIYSVAVTLSNIVLLIPDAFKELALGVVVQKNAAEKIRTYLRINVIFLVVTSIGFILLGKWFIASFYGKAYISAYYLTLILFIGDLFICVYKVIHPLLIADGKQITVLVYLGIAVIINFVLNMICIRLYGVYGAAMSSVGSYMATGILFYQNFYKNYIKNS